MKHSIKKPTQSQTASRKETTTPPCVSRETTKSSPVTLGQLWRRRNPTSIYTQIHFLNSNKPHIHPHPCSTWNTHLQQKTTNVSRETSRSLQTPENMTAGTKDSFYKHYPCSTWNTMKLIQRSQIWLVSVGKEDQARWHVLSDFPLVNVDRFSQQLN